MKKENNKNQVKDPKVKCVCGWKGRLSDLTADGDDIRCPQCGTVGWSFV